MDREVNLDSIRALEKQIQDHERAVIQLKRVRNSLLNVSIRLPPEILGKIFRWNVIPDGDFDKPSRGSYNFLLVCHHWYEVASRTPEVWCSWGNTVQDWSQRHARCGDAPLDLVLITHMDHGLDDKLRHALQDRAARDTIRKVHLRGVNTGPLNSVIHSIVPKRGETRSSSVESFILQNTSGSNMDISTFFSRHRLPKLQRLHLSGCSISLWDLLGSRPTSLTTLSLTTSELLPIPFLPQLLSILSANPNLQYLALSHGSVPHIDDDRPPSQIQLHHLKGLGLTSKLRSVFGLLNRLELPDKMDDIVLSLSECSPSDLSQTLGPYLGDRVKRRGRSPGGLGLFAYPSSTCFRIMVGDIDKNDDLTRVEVFMTVDGVMNMTLGREDAGELFLDVIAHVPRGEIVEVTTTLPILRSEDACTQMCNLTHLRLYKVDLSTWFREPDNRNPHTSGELLCRLDYISISNPSLSGGDWSTLTSFLARRAAVGNRISLLRLSDHPYMDEDVIKTIKRAVKVFEEKSIDEGCFWRCTSMNRLL